MSDDANKAVRRYLQSLRDAFNEGYDERDKEIEKNKQLSTKETVENSVSKATVDAVLNPVNWFFRLLK